MAQGSGNVEGEAGGGGSSIFQTISRLLLFYFIFSYFFGGAFHKPKVDTTTGQPLPPHQCLFYPQDRLVCFFVLIIVPSPPQQFT